MCALLTGWPTDQADGSVSSEARWRAMARQWLASGVLRGLYSEFVPSYATNVITCQPGAVWIDGHYAELTTAQGTSVTADGLLVVRYTPADGKFELLFKSGTGQVPTQTTATWELPIASMTAGAMADARAFASPGATNVLAYVERTSPLAVTSSPATFLTTPARNYDGRPVLVTAYLPRVESPAVAAQYTQIKLMDGAADLGRFGFVQTPAAAITTATVFAQRRLAPTPGSHAYGLQANTNGSGGNIQAGPGTAGLDTPAFLKVEATV
jgi:hypothetical protein